eukprot:2914815-Pyramimonas_sp.AAC.1
MTATTYMCNIGTTACEAIPCKSYATPSTPLCTRCTTSASTHSWMISPRLTSPQLERQRPTSLPT